MTQSWRTGRALRAAAAGMIAIVSLAGCGDDDDGTDPTPNDEVELELNGFPASTPAQGSFELWVSFVGVRHGVPTSMGKFRVNAQGNIVGLDGGADPFNPDPNTAWQLAVDAFITVEPAEDVDPAPTLPGFLAGDILNRQATLQISAAEHALGQTFANVSGSCVLATPSSSDATDELEGIWFTDPSGTSAALSNLPTLPTGWIYQAWATKEAYGTASLGRFLAEDTIDDDASGPLDGTGGRIDQPGYNFPGSDFPFGGTRLSLSPGGTFVTIEPVNASDGPGPFILRVLQATWGPSSAGTPMALENVASQLPSASISLPE